VAAAFAHTYWWALGFTALALVPTLLLPRSPLTTSDARRSGK